jgi:hypothetical protein
MQIETGLNPNCSEAVFRFYTDKPEIAHKILQAFADEVAGANGRVPRVVRAFQKMEEIEKVSFSACAGMGEPVTKCIWEPKKKAFVLCIGNNDIAPEGKGCNTVRELGICVEEAETCKDLLKYARDCTCGNVFFDEHVVPAAGSKGGMDS